MSLQDDIFDVEAALATDGEKEAFDRICARLNEAEKAEEKWEGLLKGIRQLKEAANNIN